jgi:hypothetical protein
MTTIVQRIDPKLREFAQDLLTQYGLPEWQVQKCDIANFACKVEAEYDLVYREQQDAAVGTAQQELLTIARNWLGQHGVDPANLPDGAVDLLVTELEYRLIEEIRA